MPDLLTRLHATSARSLLAGVVILFAAGNTYAANEACASTCLAGSSANRQSRMDESKVGATPAHVTMLATRRQTSKVETGARLSVPAPAASFEQAPLRDKKRGVTLASSYVAGTAVVHIAVGLSVLRYGPASGRSPGRPRWAILFAVTLMSLATRLMAGNLVRCPLQ